MIYMKKIIGLLGIILICFVGCSENNENDVSGTNSNVGKVTESEFEDVTSMELKKMTLDDVKEISATGKFDIDTLLLKYQLEYNSEDGYYYTPIEHNGKAFELHIGVGSEWAELKNMTTINSFTLYSKPDSIYECNEEDIEAFINRKDSLEQYLTVDIPNGYKLGTFRCGLEGIYEGCLLYKKDEKEQFYPEYSDRHGGIFLYSDEAEVFKYEGEELASVKGNTIDNTIGFLTDFENIEIAQCQALLVGVKLHETDFWHIFIDRDSNNICYMLYFNQDEFTKEQAIEIATSIVFTE